LTLPNTSNTYLKSLISLFSTFSHKKTIATTQTDNKSKLLLKNSLPVSKVSEYIGQFRAVIFTPDHLNLAKGSPEFRRRFIDMAICQSFPKYVAALNEYNRLCAQKNALLKKSYNADSSILKLLDVYNEKMAYSAGIISVNRQKYIKALSNQSRSFHKEISGGNE
ncbi:MAG: DNA replication and repair protein RecF, partial [Clostridia bacterium]|nr:DNA replication and repair protein RecF [Clostridia bacterium]